MCKLMSNVELNNWPGVVAPDSPFYGLSRTKLCIYAKLNCLK